MTIPRTPTSGWHVKWQTRCDCCGRFMLPGSPGSSWVHVPDSHVSIGDDRERCAACGEVFDLDDHTEEDDDET